MDAVSVSLESSRRGSAASHPGRAVLARFAFSVLLSAWTNSFVFVFETHPCLEEISSIDCNPHCRLDLDGGERVTNEGSEIPSVHSSPRRALMHLV